MENSCRKKHKPSPKKWILASRYSEFRRNPALIPANAGLFHYAGNNPVRYIDPDGKEDFFANWLLNWFSHSPIPPSQKDVYDATMKHCEQQFSDGVQIVQYKLSAVMEKTLTIADNAIIKGIEFMTDYGGTIAVACYASGNIGLGIMIDGVTLSCDITLTVYKLLNNKITVEEAGIDFAKSVGLSIIGNKVGKNFEKVAVRALFDKKTTQALSSIISNFVSEGASTLVDIQTFKAQE